MQVQFDTNSIDSYRLFLKVKSLPAFKIIGRTATFPDEYAARLGIHPPDQQAAIDYIPHPALFDYQRDITRIILKKRKFAVFARPGLGKTLMATETMRAVSSIMPAGRCQLMIAPPMVVNQHLEEIRRFYGDSLPIRQVMAAELQEWLTSGTERIGITNWEALKDGLRPGRLYGLVLDESSYLKSFYGAWGTRAIELGAGLEWKLALTGTPAPNDQIEYGNHAVFLDHFPNPNSFLARYFINRGQTQNRWELKRHALESFYRSLSHWCIFLTDPAVYGWKDNCDTIPPIHVQIHNVDLTPEQEAAVQQEVGGLFAHRIGGIVNRQRLARIAKGHLGDKKIATNKPAFVKALVDSWSREESTIIWVEHNDEQDQLAAMFPEAASIAGKTPMWQRVELLKDFQQRRRSTLITKGKILGFGCNLQVATRHVFNAIRDSYELYWQCICRSNRVGSTLPLNVHIPVTDVEEPQVENVLRKARRVERDIAVQEAIFRRSALLPGLLGHEANIVGGIGGDGTSELDLQGAW